MTSEPELLNMGKRSSYIDSQNNSVAAEEPGIQKHVKFWDRKNKGYITPLDTISGFITLGYSVLFSIAIGAFVGIFLSLSTQTGWFPDPLCRSNVRSLIRAKKQTQANQGAFDADGVFVPEKFDILFDKYAKSDKSGKTITVAELVRMTKEQEKLGKDVKAWAASMIELCTAYFFIGHRGSLTREDVRSAYDGTLFYRLKDAHRLMIKQGSTANIDSTGPGLVGSYLASSHGRLSIKGMEHRFQALLNAVQSKSSAAVAEYRLRDWVAYIQEGTNSIRESALPKALRRSPPSGVRGVTTPKASIYRSSKKEEDPTKLFPNGLTGVAKPDSESLQAESSLLNSLLQNRNEDEIAFANETYKISNFSEAHEPNGFRHLTQDEANLLASAAQASKQAQSEAYPTISEKPGSSSSNNESPLMSSFLRESNDQGWSGSGLTGVKGKNDKNSKVPIPTPPKKDTNLNTTHTNNEVHQNNKHKEQNHSKTPDENNTYNDKQQQEIFPSPPKHEVKTNEQSAAEILKEATITPPPEEKVVVVSSSQSNKNTHNNKKSSNKKGKGNKNKSNQVSPTASNSSGQDQAGVKRNSSIIDTKWAIAADTK